MNAHTPGPWHHGCSKDDPDFLVRNGDDWLVACTSNEDDARLIAAAPELLEIVKGALKFYGHDCPSAPGSWVEHGRLLLQELDR
jgi:hypothetical protein